MAALPATTDAPVSFEAMIRWAAFITMAGRIARAWARSIADRVRCALWTVDTGNRPPLSRAPP